MEGLADAILRDVLTRIGGYDWCVTEFVRVTGSMLGVRAFTRLCPELHQGSRTHAGTPVRVQLLGSDPESLANNARTLVALNPSGIDLNFGCPAPTVNRHRGGAALLEEPALLEAIVRALRQSVPSSIPVTAKMRLGLLDTSRALECAHALADGGADELAVHGRTKADGYRPPARWEWIARIREEIRHIPVIANGEVWTVADWRAIRSATGCDDVMIGRGAVADPFLALRIRGLHPETPDPTDWVRLKPSIALFWREVQASIDPRYTAGRLKNWLKPVARTWPEAARLFDAIRRQVDPAEVSQTLLDAGVTLGEDLSGAPRVTLPQPKRVSVGCQSEI